MKITKLMLCAAVAGAMALTAGHVSAAPATSLPLKLTSASGTAYTTANYNGKKTTTPYMQVSFNYKTLLSVITHQVALDSGKVVPPNVDVYFDPITFNTYLANNAGYYYSLSDIVYVGIDDIATTFTGDFYAGSENDMATMYLEVYGRGPDGLYYEFDIYGAGKLTAYYTGKAAAVYTGTSTVTMTFSVQNGSGYAEYQSSDEGVVSNGQFSFTGSGSAPSYVFPYSYYWWND